jgi:hypothetical protein
MSEGIFHAKFKMLLGGHGAWKGAFVRTFVLDDFDLNTAFLSNALVPNKNSFLLVTKGMSCLSVFVMHLCFFPVCLFFVLCYLVFYRRELSATTVPSSSPLAYFTVRCLVFFFVFVFVFVSVFVFVFAFPFPFLFSLVLSCFVFSFSFSPLWGHVRAYDSHAR